MRQPAIYLPHGGGPCFFMDWDPPDAWNGLRAWLEELPQRLPQTPQAILVVSAHWEADQPTLSVGSTSLLYDYQGFPPHTYQLQWDAPPATQLAQRLSERHGWPIVDRGFDHGVFIPLKVAWDVPTIPVVQLSLVRGLDPILHLGLARKLSQLRDDGVLIIGSGMSFHSFPAFFGRVDARQGAVRFNAWLESVCASDVSALAQWADHPDGRLCHPREEHLLPLMTCATGQGKVTFRGRPMGDLEVVAIEF